MPTGKETTALWVAVLGNQRDWKMAPPSEPLRHCGAFRCPNDTRLNIQYYQVQYYKYRHEVAKLGKEHSRGGIP